MAHKKISIFLTEEMVLNPSALAEPLRKWRIYRIEYGGFNEHCLYEGRIMLPPDTDPEEVEVLMERLQEK